MLRAAIAAECLPGTQPLDGTDDLSVPPSSTKRTRWLDRKLDESIASRERLWNRDFSSKEAYEKSIEPNRQHFRKYIGVVDSRLPAIMERYGDDFESGPGGGDGPLQRVPSSLAGPGRRQRRGTPGHTFNYAEIAYVIFPRPFIVENEAPGRSSSRLVGGI